MDAEKWLQLTSRVNGQIQQPMLQAMSSEGIDRYAVVLCYILPDSDGELFIRIGEISSTDQRTELRHIDRSYAVRCAQSALTQHMASDLEGADWTDRAKQ